MKKKSIFLTLLLIVNSVSSNFGEAPTKNKAVITPFDPLTAGAILTGVYYLSQKLQNDIVPQLQGTVSTNVTELTHQLDALYTRANNDLKDKLEYTLNRLDRTEVKIFQDLESLTYQIQKQLPDKYDFYNYVAKAHLSLYEATQELPFKTQKLPLIATYDIPFDPNKVVTNQVKLLGAYLDYDKNYFVYVDNIKVKPDVIGQEEIVFTMPPSIVENIEAPKYIEIKASPKKDGLFGIVGYKEQSVSLLVYPKVRYEINFKIYGKIDKLETKIWTSDKKTRDYGTEPGDGGWHDPICNPYASQGYWYEPPCGHSIWFPSDDGNVLTICHDPSGGDCVEICGNTSKGKAEYQIVMNLKRWIEEALKEDDESITIFPNSPTTVVTYKYTPEYSSGGYKNYKLEYLMTVRKIYGKNTLVETNLLNATQSTMKYVNTHIDNLNQQLTIKIQD